MAIDPNKDVRVRLKDERMDAVEVHLKKLISNVESISMALVGNDMNGKKGLVKDISELKEQVTDLTDDFYNKKLEDVKKDKYTGRLEASFGICLVFLVGLILKTLFHA